MTNENYELHDLIFQYNTAINIINMLETEKKEALEAAVIALDRIKSGRFDNLDEFIDSYFENVFAPIVQQVNERIEKRVKS